SSEPGFRFCQSCGKPLSATRTPAPGRIPHRQPRNDKSHAALSRGLLVIGGVAVIGFLAVWVPNKIRSARDRQFNHHQSVFSTRAVEAEADANSPEAMRSRLLAYISEQNNSGQDFEEKLLGAARMEKYDPDAREVWFSLPAGDRSVEGVRKEIGQFIADPARIEIATEENGYLKVGDLSLDKRPDRAFLFRTAEQNVKFDPDRELSFGFDRATYTVRLREAADYITNRNAQGGLLRVRSGRRWDGKEMVFANHGTFVAKQGEPSLTRLVEQLTGGIAATAPDARERKLQRLLDFVTKEILYDNDEANSKDETLKHPVETLISHRGDCSNKAILYGSLLEQMGEDYLFLYCPEHLTVAVRQGGFEARNGLTFSWDRQTWVIAETTAPGFRIGQHHLDKEWIIKQVEFVQRPSQKNIIINASTHQSVEFR